MRTVISVTRAVNGGDGTRIIGVGRSNCGLKGKTELANCRHTGHKNSPRSTFKFCGRCDEYNDFKYASWQVK